MQGQGGPQPSRWPLPTSLSQGKSELGYGEAGSLLLPRQAGHLDIWQPTGACQRHRMYASHAPEGRQPAWLPLFLGNATYYNAMPARHSFSVPKGAHVGAA